MQKSDKGILAISWDFHGIWYVMPLLVKHAREGDHVTIVSGNPEYGTLPYLSDDAFVKNFIRIAKEDLGISDVRCIGAVPLSHFMSHVEEIMLKVVNIIREVKPKVILLEEPDFNTLGWHALFVALMERAIHEAARPWFTPEGIIGEAHSAEAIYYWWTKNPNIIVEVSKELVESIRETAKKVVDPFAPGPEAFPEEIYLKRIPLLTTKSLFI